MLTRLMEESVMSKNISLTHLYAPDSLTKWFRKVLEQEELQKTESQIISQTLFSKRDFDWIKYLATYTM